MTILGNCVTGLFSKKSPFDYMIISKYIIQHLYRVSLICAWHKHTIISLWLLAAKINENNCTRCRPDHCYLIFNLQLSVSQSNGAHFFLLCIFVYFKPDLTDCCYILYRFYRNIIFPWHLAAQIFARISYVLDLDYSMCKNCESFFEKLFSLSGTWHNLFRLHLVQNYRIFLLKTYFLFHLKKVSYIYNNWLSVVFFETIILFAKCFYYIKIITNYNKRINYCWKIKLIKKYICSYN